MSLEFHEDSESAIKSMPKVTDSQVMSLFAFFHCNYRFGKKHLYRSLNMQLSKQGVTYKFEVTLLQEL